MRPILAAAAAAFFAAGLPAYIHVPPQTLKDMDADSTHARALTVKARSADAGVVRFEVAEVLRADAKRGVESFRLAVRADAAGGAALLDKLPVGAAAVLFTREHGAGKTARGYGYLFADGLAASVDFAAAADAWVYLRAEPSLSKVYHGPARELPALVTAVRAGRDVKVPTRPPETKDDLSLRGLLVDEARRKNSPAYPKAPLPTAWGKPAHGLQAGLRANPAVEVAGAAVCLELVVRNVDTRPRIFTHLQLAVTGESAGGVATATAAEEPSRFAPKGTRLSAYVSPGDAYPVAVVPVYPADAPGAAPRLVLAPGDNRVGVDGLTVRLGDGDRGRDVPLPTGYLDVRLPPKP